MPTFRLTSNYAPTGDQPQAIDELIARVRRGDKAQVLLGVTGSGKTFTVANVIAALGRPTLVVSHNKTLAAQLYSEFKAFFPENAVEYYVSYYDYYQPEAYIASTDTYIEKDLAINDELDRLRLRATAALLSGRRDVVVVSSVSCIYGMGNPAAFYENVISLAVGRKIAQSTLLRRLVDSLYERNDISPKSGCFRVKGDTVDIFPAYSETIVRVTLWGDEIDSVEEIDATTGMKLGSYDDYRLYPANLFITSKDTQETAICHIQDDLMEQAALFHKKGKELEAKRLQERVEYDIEMIREIGRCTGIENYSRYFDGRKPGERPYCLLDFFPKDFLVVIDESHVTVPQIQAMYGGDRSRKVSLVDYGFRLPAALDNRPLRFDEFQALVGQTIYVSATPADFELQESGGVVVEQVVRPTGLLDPPIEVRNPPYPIDDLMEEIRKRIQAGERTLVTTLTKRMAEELAEYLGKNGVSTAYIHSDVDTLERVQIMADLRAGKYDVLVGVNLLREGLDLPEVSLVAILDADKEGFLRSHRSLTQTAGRAARNIHGLVIMYAETITNSMRMVIDETERRRAKQTSYNLAHGITPRQAQKNAGHDLLGRAQAKPAMGGSDTTMKQHAPAQSAAPNAAESVALYSSPRAIMERIETLRKQMKEAAVRLDFPAAALLRDEMWMWEEHLAALQKKNTPNA